MAKQYSSRFQSKLHGCNISNLRFVTMLFILWTTLKSVDSRGRMMEPVQRSSLWRRGFDTLVNSDDDALNCGGKWRQQHENNGKCGVCGDPYDIVPRDHEAGGKYASGIISNRYTTNDTSILIVIDIINFLGGYFEFRICPHNSFKSPVEQTCLDRHQLKIEGDRYRYYPSRRGSHHLRVELPKGMTCIHCVLQWKWHTGKDWGICPDGIGRIGCGPQEEYVNCADIAIDPATAQDHDFANNAGFFNFPSNNVRRENILNPNPDVIIPAEKQPPGGIPLSMDIIRNDVIMNPGSFAVSSSPDTEANMINSEKGKGASISVSQVMSGDSGTAIQPKFQFLSSEHSTSKVPAMNFTINDSTTQANTGVHKDDIVVLPFMGDNFNHELSTNASSNRVRVPEMYTEVINVKGGTNVEATTSPNATGVILVAGESNSSHLGASVYSQIADKNTGFGSIVSPKNDNDTSTVVFKSTTFGAHKTPQLYDITTPEFLSRNIDMVGKEHLTGYIGTNTADSLVFDSSTSSNNGVGMTNVSISTVMPSTSNVSEARNDTERLVSLAIRQTRSILRVPDLSIEATTVSLNQSYDLERMIDNQTNIESSTTVSSNLQIETAEQSQTGNFSIMPGRLFGVPLVHDSGSQVSSKTNDLPKSLPTDGGASQEVNNYSSASVENSSTISGFLRGMSSFDRGTHTDLTATSGWFQNVDGTPAQEFQIASTGKISQINDVATNLLNQFPTEPNETATGYESWLQPTTIIPTITTPETSTVSHESNQTQSIRSRIMSMMGQSPAEPDSVNKSTSTAMLVGVSSERPLTSSENQSSHIPLQLIFDNLLQALQTRNLGLVNASQASQLDTYIYEQLQTLRALVLDKILHQRANRFQDTQSITNNTVMSPGVGPDAWVQPNVVGSQRDTLETTPEKAPVFVSNTPVSNRMERLNFALENNIRSQNEIQEQSSNETTSTMVGTNAFELQKQLSNIQQNQAVTGWNVKQDIADNLNFRAENILTSGKDTRQSQTEYAVPSNGDTSQRNIIGKTGLAPLENKQDNNQTQTIDVSVTWHPGTQTVQGTSTLSAHESKIQTNKIDNVTFIDPQYSVNREDFRNASQGQVVAISEQQTSHLQPGNTASDQIGASFSDQSNYIMSTEAYPPDTYKSEPSGADAWFLPDPVPLTTVRPPTQPKIQFPQREQNARGFSNRGNQDSLRSIYPRPDRVTAMYLRNVFTQLSPETNPLTVVVGLTPDMLMRAGVNPRIAESGNFGEIITALENVLGVSIRSRRGGAAVGPEVINAGGTGSSPFDSLNILGGAAGGGADAMSGIGPDGPAMRRNQGPLDRMTGTHDMRGSGRFMDPVQRRRQQLRTEATRRRQFLQEMRMIEDVMQLLGLGPEPLEPGDPGYRPPSRQGLGSGQANPSAMLDPVDAALAAGGAGGSVGGGMGMGMGMGAGRPRSQISQLNAMMEMIGL